MARIQQTPTEPQRLLLDDDDVDSSRTTRWKLLRASREIPVRSPSMTLGRGFDCDIVVDSPGASRLHARLVVAGDALAIEDAGSTNGVYVNGIRIRLQKELADGDRVLIGTMEYVVSYEGEPEPELVPSSSPSPVANDAPRVTPVYESPGAWSLPATGEPEISTETEKCDAITTLGHLADKMLVMGRTDAAIRILSNHLRGVLEAARKHDKIDDQTVRGATTYGMKLATATNDGRWIDFVIELHLCLGLLLQPEVVRQIQIRISQGVCVDKDLMRRYRIVVQELMSTGDEFDRMIGEMVLTLPR